MNGPLQVANQVIIKVTFNHPSFNQTITGIYQVQSTPGPSTANGTTAWFGQGVRNRAWNVLNTTQINTPTPTEDLPDFPDEIDSLMITEDAKLNDSADSKKSL